MSQESVTQKSKKKVELSLTVEAINKLNQLATERKRGELVSALIQKAARHRVCTPGSTGSPTGAGTAQPYPTIADQLRLLASQIDSSQST